MNRTKKQEKVLAKAKALKECPKCGTEMTIETVSSIKKRGVGNTAKHFFFGTWLFAAFRGRSSVAEAIGTCPMCGHVVNVTQLQERAAKNKKLMWWGIAVIIVLAISMAKV